MMKMKSILFTCGLAAALAAPKALGVPDYVPLIPNGGTFSCATCHTAVPTRNQFGLAFANAGHTWGASLARLDSDGDGFTNGEELGDPNGAWTPGTANPGGTITNPGDPSSHPAATAPAITTQPASQTVTAGANVSFSVVATGTAPLTYQWMKNGATVSGGAASTLTLNSVTTADAGSYTVKVSNSAGSVTSAAAMLTVSPSVVAPVITTQPANRTVTAGANVSFSVVATGTAPLTYQWMKNGATVSGGTASTLTLNSVTTADAGSYTVKVSNSAGSVTSAAALLTVNPVALSVALDSPTNGVAFVAPANVTLDAIVTPATGIANVQFFDGTTLLGTVTTPPYRLGVILTNVGEHMLTAQVTDTQGHTALSLTDEISVLNAPPGGDLPPVARIVMPRENAVFSTQSRILLVAEASDPDGSVARVEFFSGETSLGAGVPFRDGDDAEQPDGGGDDHEGASPLYYLVLTGVPAGQYSITAQVTDNLGAVTTSDPVDITVRGGFRRPRD